MTVHIYARLHNNTPTERCIRRFRAEAESYGRCPFSKLRDKKYGADKRWLPLQGEELSELIGNREEAEEGTLTIKPE